MAVLFPGITLTHCGCYLLCIAVKSTILIVILRSLSLHFPFHSIPLHSKRVLAPNATGNEKRRTTATASSPESDPVPHRTASQAVEKKERTCIQHVIKAYPFVYTIRSSPPSSSSAIVILVLDPRSTSDSGTRVTNDERTTEELNSAVRQATSQPASQPTTLQERAAAAACHC